MPENRTPYIAAEPPAWAFSLELADWWERASEAEHKAFMRGLRVRLDGIVVELYAALGHLQTCPERGRREVD